MRNFVGTCKSICSYNLICNFLIKVLIIQSQVLWCTFQTHFSMGTRHFQKVVLRRKCSSPCNSSFDIERMQGFENIFFLLSLPKSKFFPRVALVSLVSHLCAARAALVLLVSSTRVLNRNIQNRYWQLVRSQSY